MSLFTNEEKEKFKAVSKVLLHAITAFVIVALTLALIGSFAK